MIPTVDLFFYCGLFVISSIILLCKVIRVTTSPFPIIQRQTKEKYFNNPSTNTKELFPSIHEKWSVHLSVIIPAYNEEKRLPTMLDECLEYLEGHQNSKLTYEVIVVSDGSTDKTVQVATDYSSKNNNIRVLELVKNRGKGGAVRLGMLSARGCVLLFADADGATKFSDLEKLDQNLTHILGFTYMDRPEETANSMGIVCGSRAHLEKEESAQRSYFRLILMHGFHILVWLFCVQKIRDTQCGFKLLTRKSAQVVFEALHVERWAFDVEMLYIAQTLNIPILEVPVNWIEVEGSKIVPFWSWLQMGKDLLLIWLRYSTGAWKINGAKK